MENRQYMENLVAFTARVNNAPYVVGTGTPAEITGVFDYLYRMWEANAHTYSYATFGDYLEFNLEQWLIDEVMLEIDEFRRLQGLPEYICFGDGYDTPQVKSIHDVYSEFNYDLFSGQGDMIAHPTFNSYYEHIIASDDNYGCTRCDMYMPHYTIYSRVDGAGYLICHTYCEEVIEVISDGHELNAFMNASNYFDFDCIKHLQKLCGHDLTKTEYRAIDKRLNTMAIEYETIEDIAKESEELRGISSNFTIDTYADAVIKNYCGTKEHFTIELEYTKFLVWFDENMRDKYASVKAFVEEYSYDDTEKLLWWLDEMCYDYWIYD